MQDYIIVHYGELRLKGRNRIRFEERLIANIKEKCGGRVEKLSSSLLCYNSNLENFSYISGISWYASCYKLSKDFNELIEYCSNLNLNLFKNKKSFALRVKRSDKNYVYDSQQIAEKLGDIIRKKYNLSVDLKNPDINIYIEISDYMLVYYERIKGLGGFPAGIHGKVLCLLSGGIDSPVAAYEMIRKGCKVDLLHFHSFTDNNEINSTKIIKLAEILRKYQSKTRLYLIPSYYFDLNIFNSTNILGYEMILFRIFMIMIAQIIALKYNYKAIVTGDSLGQVASQTLENMAAVYHNITMLVLQPLIACDKQDIIDKAKLIGTYDKSIEPYKDCCSIVSKKPVTKAKAENIKRIQGEIDLEFIIEESIKKISFVDI